MGKGGTERELPPGEYWVVGGDTPDRKRAAFRLMGDHLDPDVITRATGLNPDISHRKGDPRPPGRVGGDLPPWRSGIWTISSEAGLDMSGNHLEDHIIWLLDRLEPVAEELRRVCADQRLEADFYCGYFMNQSNSGWDLQPRTLERIAALGASFGVDLYGPDPDVEDRRMTVEPSEPSEPSD